MGTSPNLLWVEYRKIDGGRWVPFSVCTDDGQHDAAADCRAAEAFAAGCITEWLAELAGFGVSA